MTSKTKRCVNCGWDGPSDDFTANWCDDCARAGLVAAVTTFVTTVLTALMGWALS